MNQVADQGFLLRENVLEKTVVDDVLKVLEEVGETSERRGGIRNLLDVAAIRELSQSPAVFGLVEPVLGRAARVVRGILFDKTEKANWKVPWHQDVTIAVRHRLDLPGYGPWTMKAGVLHVQPPREVLEAMLSVRLHLDPCPAENGALRVIAGSHRSGKLTSDEIATWVTMHHVTTCATGVGGALLMRPLLLHASSAAAVPGHRRVVHLDFAAAALPEGLDWSA